MKNFKMWSMLVQASASFVQTLTSWNIVHYQIIIQYSLFINNE